MIPVVTEINSIFGLSLLGLMELLTIVIAGCTTTVVIIIGPVHWQQQVKQNKITSASLILKQTTIYLPNLTVTGKVPSLEQCKNN